MSLQEQLPTPAATPSLANFPMRSGTLDRTSFWRFADEAKEATEALAERKMRALPGMSIEALRQFCTQYRFFTIDYIGDLALLLARLPFGRLRSLLSQILAEELGDGDANKAHPVVYDRFLTSIGVARQALEHPLPANQVILAELTAELSSRSAAFGVGLRGMGGECLCQTYLAVMFEHLREHPWLQAHAGDIDWEFWTIHAGEQDIIHGELTRQAIDDYILAEPEALPELARGYECSIGAWNRFWENIFDACTPRAQVLS